MQHPQFDVAVEVRDASEIVCEEFAWIDDADSLSEFAPNQADRLSEVRVITDDYGEVILPFERVQQQVAREIDIRTFFLPLNDRHHLKRNDRRGPWRMRNGQRSLLLVCRKPPEMNAEVRDSAEGAKIGELTGAVIRVAWVRINQGGEVSDAIDGRSLAEILAKRIQVEPAILTPVGAVGVRAKKHAGATRRPPHTDQL